MKIRKVCSLSFLYDCDLSEQIRALYIGIISPRIIFVPTHDSLRDVLLLEDLIWKILFNLLNEFSFKSIHEGFGQIE